MKANYAGNTTLLRYSGQCYEPGSELRTRKRMSLRVLAFSTKQKPPPQGKFRGFGSGVSAVLNEHALAQARTPLGVASGARTAGIEASYVLPLASGYPSCCCKAGKRLPC